MWKGNTPALKGMGGRGRQRKKRRTTEEEADTPSQGTETQDAKEANDQCKSSYASHLAQWLTPEQKTLVVMFHSHLHTLFSIKKGTRSQMIIWCIFRCISCVCDVDFCLFVSIWA